MASDPITTSKAFPTVYRSFVPPIGGGNGNDRHLHLGEQVGTIAGTIGNDRERYRERYPRVRAGNDSGNDRKRKD